MMTFLSLSLFLACPGKSQSEPSDSQEPSLSDTAYIPGFELPTRPPEAVTRTYSCSVADEGSLELGTVLLLVESYEDTLGYRVDGEVLYEDRYHQMNRGLGDTALIGRPSLDPINTTACLIYLWEE